MFTEFNERASFCKTIRDEIPTEGLVIVKCLIFEGSEVSNCDGKHLLTPLAVALIDWSAKHQLVAYSRVYFNFYKDLVALSKLC